MAKEYRVYKPTADVEQVKERYTEVVDVRKDDWKEDLLGAINNETTFEEIKDRASTGYQNAGAPADWVAMHKLGLKTVKYDEWKNAVEQSADAWAEGIKRKGVNKLAKQYIINKALIDFSRSKQALYLGGADKYDLRPLFHIYTMEAGRKIAERKLAHLLGLISDTEYTNFVDTVLNDYKNKLLTRIGLSEADANTIATELKNVAEQSAQDFFANISGQ